jgi:integrase
MRGGEAFPLRVDQVAKDHIDLVEDKARGLLLKNGSSVRTVPLHSCLLGLGFMEFVEGRRRAEAKGRLFPTLKRTFDLSRFFGTALKKVGIVDRRLSLHSTRHYWGTALTTAGVQSEVRHRLLGHSLPSSAQNSTYVHLENAFSLEKLKEAIEKVQF